MKNKIFTLTAIVALALSMFSPMVKAKEITLVEKNNTGISKKLRGKAPISGGKLFADNSSADIDAVQEENTSSNDDKKLKFKTFTKIASLKKNLELEATITGLES